MFRVRLFPYLLLLATLACNGGAPADPGSAEEGDSCDALLDCGDGLVCLAVGQGASSCTLTCSGSVDACGASTQCAGVGALEVDVCQPPESVPDAENPPEEDERTSIPCREDAECDVLFPGAVCGTWRGWKECTLPCTSPDICNPPPIGGVTVSFSTCGADEDADRDICIPDEACFVDPFACIDFGGFPF